MSKRKRNLNTENLLKKGRGVGVGREYTPWLKIQDVSSNGRSKRYLPFGKGPWPCLNPAAQHFKEIVIGDVTISRGDKTGLPLGTFICNCGFVYSRLGSDRDESDCFKKSSIKTFGKVWIEEVNSLFNQGNSIHSIARRLEADWKTIHKCIYTNFEENKSRSKNDLLRKAKITLIEVKNSEPNLTRTEIRKKNSKVYDYLLSTIKIG